MTDNLSPEDRHKTMQAVKGKGNRLERKLYSMLAGMKLSGWTKNAAQITGKPDVAFVAEKVAIFMDGCFWHGCPICNRKLPRTNHEYWERKINRNKELARIHNDALVKDGWVVIRIWEHEIRDQSGRRIVRTRLRGILNKESADHELSSGDSWTRMSSNPE